MIIEPAVDRLFSAVEKKGHVCVGLDTSADFVPAAERGNAANDAEAVLAFNRAIVDAVFDSAACFKVQIAYYEEMGVAGLQAYSKTLKYIREKGGIVIADIKRGDIADTAKRYAKAHFSGDFEADFVTLNPYMGMDSIEPWLSEAQKSGKGAFVLMRTSNPGSKDFQYKEINHEPTRTNTNKEQAIEAQVRDRTVGTKVRVVRGKNSSEKSRLYHAVGDKLADLAASCAGKHGYGLFGAVVGCTETGEAAEIREMYPNLFFLIPGYGAQGGGAKDAAILLRDGNGGVVNASRSIITAWQKDAADAKIADNAIAAEAACRAAVKMRDEIRNEL